MAKKKKSGGTSLGLIMVLIFFVLGTFICGTVAYYGYSEQEQFKTKTKEAEEKLAKAETRLREERARKIVLRHAIGVESPEDRVVLVSEWENFKPQMMEEADSVLLELKDKTPEPFRWPLLSGKSADEMKRLGEDPDAIRNDKENKFGLRPTKYAHDMAFDWKKKYDTDIKRGKIIDENVKEFAAVTQRVTSSQTDDKKVFTEQIAKQKQQIDDNYAKIDAEYKKLVAKHAQDGAAAVARIATLGKEVNDVKDELGKANDSIRDMRVKLEKYETQERRLDAVAVDLLIKEEAKGKIVAKDQNDFVTIDIGSNRKLKPQVRFLVVAAGTSWMALEEKEASIKRFTVSNDRQPYEDNPYVKAAVEVVEILGPDRARAKILFQNNRIRNPVQVQDQVFNPAWQPEEQIRVAFAGIIDLDGDGIDNNQEFLTQLERHGVIVDEYLKMNPLDFVKRDGRGLSLQTKYLIIADDPRFEGIQLDPNSPQRKYVESVLGKMSDIKARARQLGVQLVDARKFVSLMGYKLPKNPAPLQYGSSVYWGANANVTPPMKDPN